MQTLKYMSIFMKTEIVEANVLRKVTTDNVIELLRKEGLFKKLNNELKHTKERRIVVVKKYLKILGNISYLNQEFYEWGRK